MFRCRAKEFQSTLPYGSDSTPELVAPAQDDFNPRSLAGATSHLQAYIARHIKFQFTLPYRSDVPLLCFRQGKSRFQSTLPYRSDNINFIVHEIKEKSKFFANPYK